MTYVLIGYAPDGVWHRTYRTEKAALDALFKQLGLHADFRDTLAINKTYYDDWGRRLIVEVRHNKVNARTEDALHRAYDARECGVATKRQVALLEKHGF